MVWVGLCVLASVRGLWFVRRSLEQKPIRTKDVPLFGAPIKDVLDRMAQTLAAGNRLWIVGDLPAPEPNETEPLDLPAAPGGPQGWFDVPYSYVWGRQADYFIAAHGGHIEAVPTGSDDAVSIYEKASLSVVKGWSLR